MAAQADCSGRAAPTLQGPMDLCGWVSPGTEVPNPSICKSGPHRQNVSPRHVCFQKPRSSLQSDSVSMFTGSEGRECQKLGFGDTE